MALKSLMPRNAPKIAKITMPECAAFLAEPHRYKIMYGGRNGVKSWSMARQLLINAVARPIRWLCCRETMITIADSVHALLQDQIKSMGMGAHFDVQKSAIYGINGSRFVYAGLRGLRRDPTSLKSFESFDGAWVEEAQRVSKDSWNVLIPTIRKEGSEIWGSFNPELEKDETYQRFVLHPPPGAVVRETSYRDNPWLSEEARADMEHMKETDPSEFDHIYEGMCRSTVEGAYFSAELAAAEKADRLARVPCDPLLPVHTFWDIGLDTTAIWFAQFLPFEYHLIDYFEDAGQKIGYYLEELQKRSYLYAMHHLPHDAKAKELGTGKSIEERVRAAYPEKVCIVPKLEVRDRINAARTVFPQCWFDRERCAEGIQALRHYRKAPADTLGRDTGELHDWSSHGGSAFCYFGVDSKPPARPKKKVPGQYLNQQQQSAGPDAWMA